MLASTHIIAGVALASLMEGNLAAMAVTAVFAILPDIDTANSFWTQGPNNTTAVETPGCYPFTLNASY